MIKITNFGTYYECTFLNGNLIAFSLIDLFSQLRSIYNIELPQLFIFDNLN